MSNDGRLERRMSASDRSMEQAVAPAAPQAPLEAIKSLYRRVRALAQPNLLENGTDAAEAVGRLRIPAGERIYAIGDVHGREDLLAQKFAEIDRHIAAYPVARPITVLLGDYIDRGPNSRKVIDLILRRREAREVIALAGNHEALLLGFLTTPETYPEWRKLGGAETLMSYGILPPPEDEVAHFAELAESLSRAMPDSHLTFLKTLPLALSQGDFLFVHAGVRPGVPLDKQVMADVLWIRDEFLAHRSDFGAMIVHGHSRVLQPEIHANRINIDTGAYISSRLTCLVIDEEDLSFL